MEDRPQNPQAGPPGDGPDGPSNGSDTASGMSTGMKVGIGIGILVAALLLIWIVTQLGGQSGGAEGPDAALPETPAVATATAESEDGTEGDGGTDAGDDGDRGDGGIVIVVPTAVPGEPTVTANVGVYIRGGPSTDFPIVGTLAEGASAQVLGINQAGDWWAVALPTSPNGVGWVSAEFVTAANADGVSVVQSPPTPMPTPPPPIVISDWKGEYFDNRDLQGAPVLTRNDTRIDFNWGSGSPGPEVPNDNFSARWTINRNAPGGIYAISVWVDDGVRVWVDNDLVIDGWSSGPARNYNTEVQVEAGAHDIRVEYFEETGGALISLSIRYQGDAVAQPPTAVISGPTEGTAGTELRFSARGSTVAEGSHIVSTAWDFGDGATATGNEVTHTYTAAGVYSVLLTLTDDKGLSSTATQQVRIAAAEDPATPEPPVEPTPEPTEEPVPTEAVPPTAAILVPETITVGMPATFDGSRSSSVNPIESYIWDMGDGTTADGAVVEHTYAAEGAYTVSLTVVDSEGLSSNATTAIDVAAMDATQLPEPLPTEAATPAPEEEAEDAAASD